MPETNDIDLRLVNGPGPLDDPRLTAFALDELDDPADRQAVEALLADDAAAARFVDDVRQAARLLTDALRKEPSPGLDPKHRDAIEEELMPTPESEPEPQPATTAKPRSFRRRALYALAAVVLIGGGLALLLPSKTTQRNARTVAEHEVALGPPSRLAPVAAPRSMEEQYRKYNTRPSGTAGGYGPGAAQGYGSPAPASGRRAAAGAIANNPNAANQGQYYGRMMTRDPNQPIDAEGLKSGASVAAGDKPAQAVDGRAMGGMGGMMGGGMGGGMGGQKADLGRVAGRQGQPANPGATAPAAGLTPFRTHGGLGLDTRRDLASGAQRPQRGVALGLESKAEAKDAKQAQVAALDRGREAEVLRQRKAGAQPPPPAAAAAKQEAGKPVEFAKVEGQTSVVRIEPGLQQQAEPAQQVQPAQQQADAALQLAEPPANEAYAQTTDNPFLVVRPDREDNRLSTFSIDVDTASYSNMRRFLNQNAWPPKDSVRIEEFLNYFPYNYPQPTGDDPFSINVEVARCPWKAEHRLVRIGLKGKEIAPDRRPNSNLVFLIDVSGSMADANKLPYVKAALRLLVGQLGEGDRVSIVTYAGTTGIALPSTPCTRKDQIIATIDRLESGGSTNGGAGLNLAYDQATANFLPGGVNRVILCTDGDFNQGLTDTGDLVRLVEDRAKRKISLSVLGFGMGNLKDERMEQLADKGDGNYAYIDTLLEARKHLVDQLSGTLVTIAKDVKVQVEFNPAKVAAYRLIGYEDRLLAKEDFDDDTKDAGEIGAGHTVTALYEVVPAGAAPPLAAGARPLKYGLAAEPKPAAGAAVADLGAKVKAPASDELMTVFLRYKAPDGDTSKLLERPVTDAGLDVSRASDDFKFASAVASFGMILRGSPHKGSATLDTVLELARAGTGADPSGYRKEFVDLVQKAKQVRGR